MKPVTDPSLLEQLNNDKPGLKPVSDPALLSQLEGKTTPSASWTDNIRDITAAALKIGPTALKGVADLGRLATGDRLGVDTSNAMKRGMEAIDQVIGSDALNAQKANISQALQDPNVGIRDLPGVVIDNPRAAGDAAVSAIGSMFLPTGVVVGATKALPTIAKFIPRAASVAPGAVATGASVGTGAAQNAAETFVDTEGQSMGDRYKGAGLSGAASLVLGKLLGGGAEGVVARRLAGESVGRGAVEAGKSAVKTGAKEFLQEGGEESSNYVGKQVAKGEAIDPQSMGKQGLYGGMIGLGVGAGTDVATNVGDIRKGGIERQVARAIDEAAQDIADRQTPQVIQQTVARIFDQMPQRRAPEPESQPKALGFDPTVRNPPPTMQVDPQGNASPIPSDQQFAIDSEKQRMNDLGFTPDVQRAAAQRAQSPEPGPVSTSSDLIQRLMGTGWTPPAPQADGMVLQNRNRATPSSVAQMTSIAGNPDYGRLGFSRDFANGAPVVSGGSVPATQIGKSDVAVASDGRRIPVQYAVVEADQVLASNKSDGTANADYGNDQVQAIRAIAGNGRIAGLQSAYGNAKANTYRKELTDDALHGIDKKVIKGLKQPVLVRIMPKDSLTADIGDVSNTVGNLTLSPVEQAKNDAQRVSLDALQFSEDGSVNPETVRQFVRAMPQSEQGGLLDTNGQPTKQAVDRIAAAVFARAYGNDQLVRLYAQAQDPEARLILSALSQVAPKMARLEGAGALDIRDVVTQAAEIAVNARREGIALAKAAQQLDMTVDPLVGEVLGLFVRNARSVKPVVEALSRAADMAYTEANKPAEDMFGAVPRASRGEVINQLKPEDERTSPQDLERAAGREPVQEDAQRQAAGPAGQGNAEPTQEGRASDEQGTDPQVLTSYTPKEIEDRLNKLEQAEKERQQQEREAEQRAQADAQRDDFALTGSDRPADVGASRGQTDIFSAPDNAKDSGPETPLNETLEGTPKRGERIEDFGEKIGGARKDVWTSFKDQLGEVADEDIASQPLSKVWPQPDYQALLDGGADPWSVAFARSARGEIPSKPRQPWKVKRWAEQVRSLRDMTLGLMDGRYSVEKTKEELRKMSTQSRGMYDLGGRIELYMLVGHRQSLDGVRISSGEYSVYNGVEYKPAKVIWAVEKSAAASAFRNWPRQLAIGSTKEEALKAFKERYDAIDINPAAKKETTFEVYSRRGQDGYWVGKKVGRNPIFLAGPFDNIKAARDYKANNQAELVEKLAKSKEIPNERRDTNEPRVGEDMRNGQDVTPQMFGETFGFRGVEFGNWVEQGRRQKDLNDAFDALMDMAAILNVPPKALSLNGELGLAFGARGGGGVNPAAAHYERDKIVINLTKKSGAGSLGHEWWHALDNYFSRARAKGDGMMTDALDVSLASRGSNFVHQGAVRKEMIEAFGAVMKSIRETAIKARSKKLDDKRSKEYWTTDPEMSARAFESYLISKLQDQDASNDYLANIVSPETWKAAEAIGFELEDSYPYPTAGEIPAIRAGFDKFFETIESRETERGIELFRTGSDADGIRLYNRSSAGASAPGKMSLDAIQKAAQTAVKGVPNAPDIEVVANPAAAGITVAPGVSPMGGTLPDGRILLFADQISSVIDVHQTVFHELFHRGAKVRFDRNADYIAAMLDLSASDATVRRLAIGWKKSTDGQDKRTMYEERGPLTGDRLANYEALAVEEALAEIAETVGSGEFKPPRSLIERIVQALAKVADTFGMARLARWLREAQLSTAEKFIVETLRMSGGTPNQNTTAVLFSQGGVQSVAEPWNVPEPGTGDAFVRAIQNNKIDVKRVRDAIAEKYGKVADDKDAYLGEELYHGRVAARVNRIYEEKVEPILKKIAVAEKNFGIGMDDVNTYLHARHAPERNAAMKAINPDMKDNDALSGMSDEEAAKVLADFKAAGKDKALSLIAAEVDQVLADTRTDLVADGLEDAGVVAAWESAYKHYVPLQRDIKGSGTPKGMGFSVRGPESKRAVGSNLAVVNILANVFAQAETAAIRAEKAVVGRTLLAMAQQYPNPDFWKVDVKPTKPRINKDTGLVERSAIDPLYQTADNVLMVKDYGQEHFIVFNKKNERALAMAHAMKNLDIAPMNKILEVASKGTRFLASLLTQRNPLFWLTNFARDVQGALINLEGTDAEGLQRQVMANLPKAFKGMHAIVRGEGTGQWARYAKEMQEAGGTTGYMQAFENSDARMKDLKAEVAKMQQGKADPRRLARMTLEFVDDYNDIIENAVRLSVFQAAREGGASTAKSASIAKNITVNFNRKGNLTPPINALYMFFNASVQGTARLLQAAATSKTAQAAVGGIAVMGFMLDMLNRMAAGDDDETKRNRYDLIPEFEKSRNWIFMNPMRPGEYVKVPLPLGPHVFHNAGRLMSDAINRKDARNASEYGWSLAGILLDAFSPLGQAASAGQLIAPSVLDPMLQVTENKSFTGAPVYKSAEKGFGKTDPKPAYTRHFDSTPDVWVGASKMLNDVTGGDKVKPGAIDISPDIMKHVFYTMTGGPGRTLDQAIDTAQAGAKGKEFSVNRVPLASRFYGANDDAQRERAYYDDRKRALDAKQTFDDYIKNGRQDEARKVAEELGDGDAAKGRKKMRDFSAAEKSVRRINGQIRRELERNDDGEAKAEQLRALRQRRVRVMSDALDDE